MKITEVKPWVIETDWDLRPGDDGPRALTKRQFVFLKGATDEGITGWGEITTYPGRVAMPTSLELCGARARLTFLKPYK